MRCQGAISLSLLAALVAGVMAGDLMEDLRRDLELGLFARQQPITNFQVRNHIIRPHTVPFEGFVGHTDMFCVAIHICAFRGPGRGASE